MKKIIISLLMMILLVLSSCTRSDNNEVFAIEEYKSYIYYNDMEVNVSLYCSPKISILGTKPNNSYYLEVSNHLYDVEINDIKVTEYNDYYYITYSVVIPSAMKDKGGATYFIIESDDIAIRQKIGILEIFDDEMELLSFDELYGIYTKVDGGYILSGLNLVLSSIDHIDDVTIGSYAYGDLGKALFDTTIPNEADLILYIPNYEYIASHNPKAINLKNKRVVIPITYDSIYMIKTGVIIITVDETKYYIDTFSFLNNQLSKEEYSKYIVKGEIICSS